MTLNITVYGNILGTQDVELEFKNQVKLELASLAGVAVQDVVIHGLANRETIEINSTVYFPPTAEGSAEDFVLTLRSTSQHALFSKAFADQYGNVTIESVSTRFVYVDTILPPPPVEPTYQPVQPPPVPLSVAIGTKSASTAMISGIAVGAAFGFIGGGAGCYKLYQLWRKSSSKWRLYKGAVTPTYEEV